MSSPVSAYTSSTNSLINSGSSGLVSSGSAQVAKSDSEVIAQVVSTPMQSSNINEVVAPVRESIEKIAADLQKFVQSMGRDLNFSVDETTGYHVVRVVDQSSGELIRQLPSDELLKLAREFEQLQNALVSQRA
ncbi:MAG: flagellar protein FlaG [Betaproteobacteria bacterium]|nr:flagellar protein FlaG [Betaproteobacteria bacterium]